MPLVNKFLPAVGRTLSAAGPTPYVPHPPNTSVSISLRKRTSGVDTLRVNPCGFSKNQGERVYVHVRSSAKLGKWICSW